MTTVLIVIAALIILLLVVVATRPAAFRIARRGQVRAAPDTAFAIINDLALWSSWSPFEALDPAMSKTISTPSGGPGATYAWTGNAKAGAGRMTILETTPARLIVMQLQFTRPFACTNLVRFEIEPTTDGCQVSWIMDGRNGFMGKLMSLAIDMDRMVGKDFAKGLVNLDAVAHRAADPS